MIKRPFALAGFTMLASQVVALYCGADVKIVLCALLVVLLGYLLLRHPKKTGALIVIICAVLTFAVNTIYMSVSISPSRVLDGKTVLVTGEVISEPEQSYSRSYYYIRTSSVALDGAPQNIKLRLSSTHSLELDVGDKLTANISFGSFDELESYSRLRLLSDGISAAAFISPYADYSVERGGASAAKLIVQLRDKLCSVIKASMPEDAAGLSIAILLGDKSELKTSTISDFRVCGMSHLLAVSGIHLGIIASLALYLLRRLGLGYKLSSLASIPIVLLYMALTGFSSSATRAGIMVIIAMIAVAVGRDYDGKSALGAALSVMCLFGPCAAGDVGLLLSAGCTAGLLYIVPKFTRREKYRRLTSGKSIAARVRRNVISGALTSVVASLCSLPIAVLMFEETSVISPLSNLLCVVPATFLLMLVCVVCMLSVIPVIGSGLCIAVGALASVPARYLLFTSSLLSEIPGACVSAGAEYMPMLVAACAAVLIAWRVLFAGKPKRRFALIMAAAVIVQMTMLALAADALFSGASPSAVVYDLEGGVGVMLRSGGDCVLIGSGGNEYMSFEMTHDVRIRSGGSIDAVMYPSDEDAVASYAVELVGELEPDAVFVPAVGSRAELLAACAREAGCSVYDVSGGTCSVGKICAESYTDENGCVWIYAEVGDMSLLVCPRAGDCLLLPEELSCPDCAVIPDGSMANITSLNATTVIVCADYGDSALIKQQLQVRGIRNIFSPSLDGTLELSSAGNGIAIETE